MKQLAPSFVVVLFAITARCYLKRSIFPNRQFLAFVITTRQQMLNCGSLKQTCASTAVRVPESSRRFKRIGWGSGLCCSNSVNIWVG